jgi:hypothetical protein
MTTETSVPVMVPRQHPHIIGRGLTCWALTVPSWSSVPLVVLKVELTEKVRKETALIFVNLDLS